MIPHPTVPELFATRIVGGEKLSAWKSSSTADSEWDSFLQSVPTGHFQQSSTWGDIKSTEGWTVTRIVVRGSSSILGGFQFLARRRWLFREALLNKGPVFVARPDLAKWLYELIDQALARESIDLLLVQPPDEDQLSGRLLAEFGYLPNRIVKIITATFCIPLGAGRPPFESRMRRSLQLEARQAKKRGVVVREGGANDIPAFFEMMSASARRQGSTPNPASERALLQLWQGFQPARLSRLTLAEDSGRPVAGLLSIRFGNRVTQWKKGWTGEAREKHPNTLLAVESIEWAQANGATLVDFAGGNRAFAESLHGGTPPTPEQRSSRDFYLIGLGAEPVLLPFAQIRIRRLVPRIAYSAVLALRRSSAVRWN